jgi:Ca2+-binding EF-hand superfamily protein
LDRNRNNYIDVLEFIEGMAILFSENYEKLIEFIFDFYDFNKDGKISKEDVRVVLSYIPLNLIKLEKYSELKLKFENEEYKDRVESQEELFNLMEKSFKSNELDLEKFKDITENVSSDIFLFILIFLMEKKPFSKKTIKEFKGRTFTSTSIKINKSPVLTSKLIASPNLHSKFSPSVTISRSPMMSKRITLNSLSGKDNKESKNLLMKLAGKPAKKEDIGEEELKMHPVNRKQRNDLKNLNSLGAKNNVNHTYNDLPIVPGIKHKGISNDKLEIYM